MILTLTPNPALDVTYRVPGVTLGQSHRVEHVTERAGGKGLNTASVLAAMSRECLAIAPVGRGAFQAFADDLTSRGVPHSLVESPSRTRRSIAVVDESGEATLFNEAGEPQSQHVWDTVVATVVRAARQASVLTVSGSLPPAAPVDLVHRITSAAHEAGLRVVLDVSGAQLSRALPLGPALVKPNRAEAAATFGGMPRDIGSPAELALALDVAGARAAVVSDGVNGLTLVSGDIRLHAWLPKALRGNATGAGDALTAAFAAELQTGDLPADRDRWADVLRAGVAWSAAAVLQPVAGAIDPTDVAALQPTVEIEELR